MLIHDCVTDDCRGSASGRFLRLGCLVMSGGTYRIDEMISGTTVACRGCRVSSWHCQIVKFYTLLNISSSRLTAECGKGYIVLTGGRKTKPMLEGFCYERPRRTRIEQNSRWYLSDRIGFQDNYMNYCRLQDNCLIVPNKNSCGLRRFESWCSSSSQSLNCHQRLA